MTRTPPHLHYVELVDLAVSWKQRLSIYELAHDAPDGPQVDGGIVSSGSQQKLRRTIPPARFFKGHRAISTLLKEKQTLKKNKTSLELFGVF